MKWWGCYKVGGVGGDSDFGGGRVIVLVMVFVVVIIGTVLDNHCGRDGGDSGGADGGDDNFTSGDERYRLIPVVVVEVLTWIHIGVDEVLMVVVAQVVVMTLSVEMTKA